ncbi:DUF2065 domain-containing protein [Roseospira marina]|uniref:DUF2065 domain-containing protein n=1 Tax=Roseospira marina TaxID=140057 RepID=A0A5M6IB96_9PROT|nr:DUF2065 domain-containing protein [Roseospira marina]KAA5605511.1 DUF2065 domain-containing protein [Roseospira marina]MBB4314482.1 hypothetical protein [Roseospira marina]MBB5088690.1 hypothetical protein [Roseospira marina]
MVQDLLTALGLVLVIEGLLYAVFLTPMRAMIRAALDMSDNQLRISGLVTMAIGVVVVWLVRL